HLPASGARALSVALLDPCARGPGREPTIASRFRALAAQFVPYHARLEPVENSGVMTTRPFIWRTGLLAARLSLRARGRDRRRHSRRPACELSPSRVTACTRCRTTEM